MRVNDNQAQRRRERARKVAEREEFRRKGLYVGGRRMPAQLEVLRGQLEDQRKTAGVVSWFHRARDSQNMFAAWGARPEGGLNTRS